MRAPVLVIVPTRDRPRMLAEALRSLQAQAETDWTAVVADDGEEATAEAVVAEQRLSDRVEVVRTAARSPGGARNAAFEHGEATLRGRDAVVAFLDDDDLWLPLHLRAVREALERDPGLSFVHTGALTLFAGAVSSYHRRGDPPSGEAAFAGLLERNVVATSSVAMPARTLRAQGGFRTDLSHGEDWDLWLRCAWKQRVGFLPEPSAIYREHGGNTSGAMAEKAASQVRALEPWWDRRAELERSERRALARALGRRQRSHVRRLLREGAPRSAALAAARAHHRRLPRLRTLLSAFAPR